MNGFESLSRFGMNIVAILLGTSFFMSGTFWLPIFRYNFIKSIAFPLVSCQPELDANVTETYPTMTDGIKSWIETSPGIAIVVALAFVLFVLIVVSLFLLCRSHAFKNGPRRPTLDQLLSPTPPVPSAMNDECVPDFKLNERAELHHPRLASL